ncbi:MAG: HDOD domain-containing protein [Candidatus Krumholzibacteriia bacterium]
MSDQRNDITQLLDTLGRLKGRVQDLGAQIDTAVAGEPAGPETPDGVDPMVLLRATLAEVDVAQRASDIPGIFRRFAERTGLRMLVIKRWRSGLQVVAEHNINLPEEAHRKLPNGRAPIVCDPDDIFAVAGRDRQVYAGPVPIKAFPTDLTLLMGRGAQDRHVIIVPLPARERWSTFLYLDGEPSQQAVLTVAEFLARHTVDRMRLLQMGERPHADGVNDVLKHELYRRQQREADPSAPAAPSLDRREPRATAPDLVPDLEVDWLSRGDEPAVAEPARRQTSPLDLGAEPPVTDAVPRTARVASQARAEADAIVGAWEDALLGGPSQPSDCAIDRGVPAAPMAPAAILHQSGDLPAMPKAALHILSVIDDPRTTATRLEKAVAMDQALTAKILRIANSPFYGAVREIKTVSESIVRLGFVTIRNWTLVTATKAVFLGAGATPLFHKIWRQSVLSAMASQLVSQALRKGEPETVFVGGLMQNIGQLVLARSQPDLFHQVLSISAEEQLPYYVVEQELLGFDHGDLGALLIKEWNLSEDLEQAVRWHHRLDHPDVECVDLAALVALGEEVAACSGSADPDGAVAWGPSLAARHLGVSADLVTRLRQQSRDLAIDSSFFA